MRPAAAATQHPHRLLYLLLLHLAASPSTVVGKLVRISLETNDLLRLVGVARFDFSDHQFRVVFDTGSSDTWVATTEFSQPVGAAKCHERNADNTFMTHYGSGAVSGFAVQTDLQLGDEADILIRHVCVGIVRDLLPDIEKLGIEGVVGLGMESLAMIHRNSSILSQLSRQQPQNTAIFSLFISSSSGAQPPSQLLLGGVDPSLMKAKAAWFSFPVISQPAKITGTFKFGFWSIKLHGLAVGNKFVYLNGPGNRHGVALVDSGTSFVLLPPEAFNSVAQEMSSRLGSRFLSSATTQPTRLTCRSCQAHEFPSLTFAFVLDDSVATQHFVLQGSNYARCDRRRRECTAMLDVIQPSELNQDFPTVVLGTVFLRVYYAQFDYTYKRVVFACTVDDYGVCSGGQLPVLDYNGHPFGQQQVNRTLTGVSVAATALALLAGVRMLLGNSWTRK